MPENWREWLPGAETISSAVDWLQRQLPAPSPAAQALVAQREQEMAEFDRQRAERASRFWGGAATAVQSIPGIDSARQTVRSLFETPADLQPVFEQARQANQARASHPVPVINAILWPQRALGGALINQAEQLTSPGGAALSALDWMDAVPGNAAAAAAIPGLFSRVDKIAEAVGKKGVHPNKLKSLLQSGASQEEVAYRKVNDLIAKAGNQPITKEALTAHLAANPAPEVTRTLLGESGERRMRQAQLDALARLGDERTPEQEFEYSRLAQQLQHGQTYGIDPKFSSYTLPGGEDYAEHLYQLRPPEHARPAAGAMTPQEQFDLAPRSGGDLYHTSHFDQPNILTHVRTKERTLPTGERGRFLEEVQSDWHQAGKRQGYRTAATPEILARMDELRTEVDRSRQMVADINAELRQVSNQNSDRVRMLTYPQLPPEFAHIRSFGDATRESRQAVEAWRRARESIMGDPELVRLREAEQIAQTRLNRGVARVDQFEQELNTLHDAANKGVPDAPFKETWPDLALKQQLLDVTQNHPDLSWLGFTSGKTQNERYDLSKQVSRLAFEPEDAGDFSLGTLVAYDKHGDEVLRENRLEPTDLDEYIGRGPAEALRRQIASKAHDAEQWSVVRDADDGMFYVVDPNGEYHGEGFGTRRWADDRLQSIQRGDYYSDVGRDYPQIEGLDLQVGGEGMQSFYDNLLPARLRKILAPFGGTVERGAIPVTKKEMVDTPGFSIIDDYGNSRGWWPTREEAEAYIANPPEQMRSYVSTGGSRVRPTTGAREVERQVDEPAWIARLTPELRERIRREGLPLMALPLITGVAATGAASERDR